MEESVTTLCPSLVLQDRGLDRAEYEIVRNSILKHLLAYGAMTTEQLGLLVEYHLQHKYHGSLHQFYTAVRQALEGCGEIRRVPNTNPQLIELSM